MKGELDKASLCNHGTMRINYSDEDVHQSFEICSIYSLKKCK